MASLVTNIEVSIVEHRIVFFPVASFTKAGDVVLLRVFGIPIYKRAGSVKSLFGFVWNEEERCECKNCQYTRKHGGLMVCLNKYPLPMPSCKPPRAE